jgi:hypothetical protein
MTKNQGGDEYPSPARQVVPEPVLEVVETSARKTAASRRQVCRSPCEADEAEIGERVRVRRPPSHPRQASFFSRRGCL